MYFPGEGFYQILKKPSQEIWGYRTRAEYRAQGKLHQKSVFWLPHPNKGKEG